jgi:two-component system, sensor histidine kinase PdtaS
MSWFKPNIREDADFYERGKFLLAWRLSIFFVLVFGLLSGIYVLRDLLIFTYYFITFIIAFGTFVMLQRTGKHKLVFWIFTFAASFIVTISMFTIQYTLHYSDLLWMVCIVLFSFIGLGRRVGISFMVFLSVVMSYFVLFQLNTNLTQLQVHRPEQIIVVWVEVVFAFAVMTYLTHEFLVFQRYTEKKLKETNVLLEKQNRENLFLVKEVHHRVKNNLQIIISLLKMQREELKSKESEAHFNEAINRIMTISLVHQKLYQEKELAHVNLNNYLGELVVDIARMTEDQRDIKMVLNNNLERVGLKTIIPLGLLLNELITNSYKHAFNQSQSGAISIHVRKLDTHFFELEYSDSGEWKTPGERGGFGLELIELLTAQLDGTVNRTGSTYLFKLANLDH